MRARSQGSIEKDKIFLSFGKTMALWALLERSLYEWFQHITLLDGKIAKPLYFSAKSTSNRLEILRATLKSTSLDEAERVFIEEAIKLVQNYSSFRNKLAHGEFTFEGQVIESKHHDRKKAIEKSISQEAIEIAGRNFSSLTLIIREAHDLAIGYEPTEKSSLEICLQQLKELPREANSTTPNVPTSKSKPESQK
jgi:hypothetical protein